MLMYSQLRAGLVGLAALGLYARQAAAQSPITDDTYFYGQSPEVPARKQAPFSSGNL